MTFSPDSIRLDGRVTVVTGGGAGIGRGIVGAFRAFGAQVAIWERNADAAAAVAAEHDALGLCVDVRESAQVDVALVRTAGELGTPTILVNNAGGTFRAPLLDTSEKGWDALQRSNLHHVMLCTQRIARRLVDEAKSGSIINVTSIEGVRAAPGYAAYAAAKAGVINFTQTAALELASHGIRVNALAPDITLTEGLAALASDGAMRAFDDVVPLGRPGHVDDLGAAAVLLASAMSSYITGQTIHVDGGTHAAGGWYRDTASGDYVLGPPRPDVAGLDVTGPDAAGPGNP